MTVSADAQRGRLSGGPARRPAVAGIPEEPVAGDAGQHGPPPRGLFGGPYPLLIGARSQERGRARGVLAEPCIDAGPCGGKAFCAVTRHAAGRYQGPRPWREDLLGTGSAGTVPGRDICSVPDAHSQPAVRRREFASLPTPPGLRDGRRRCPGDGCPTGSALSDAGHVRPARKLVRAARLVARRHEANRPRPPGRLRRSRRRACSRPAPMNTSCRRSASRPQQGGTPRGGVRTGSRRR